MSRITILFCLLYLIISPESGSAQKKYPSVLIVAKDGTGNYETIQEAVNSVRDLGAKEVTIQIRNGLYAEKVTIPSWKTHITLIGEDSAKTVITNADYSGKTYPNTKDAYGLEKFSTFNSYTMLVQGNDFAAKNLTIANTAGRVGQAVALHVEGDRAQFNNCRFLGNQDTFYAATSTSRQYYKDCYFEGTTDFIFGEATVVFQNCLIKSLSNSYVTAAATSASQQFGFVFFDCKLVAEKGVNKVYLGRPWRPYAKTVFIRAYLDTHIDPAGWNAWPGDEMFPDKDKTAYYAEYKSTGPGAVKVQSPPTAISQSRVSWSKQLTEKELKSYSLAQIFKGWSPKIN